MNKKQPDVREEARKGKAFPFLSVSLKERLRTVGAIDLRDNFKIHEKNGYMIVRAIDPSRKMK